MILADKIIILRKRSGWSQEELAYQLNVSRQAVSKWEGAQSIPDMNKILHMSELFGVSTDYLLKDELEEEEFGDVQTNDSDLRLITMEEATEYLELRRQASKKIALATMLCILSPFPLILLIGLQEFGHIAITENVSIAIGLIILILTVAVAVGMFVYAGSTTSKYEFIEKNPFETQYGVKGMVTEAKEAFHATYTKGNILGVTLCILSVLPIFLGLTFPEDSVAMMIAVSILLVIVSFGVFILILVGVPWESYRKLLQEDEYSKKSKDKNKIEEAVSSIYWLIIVGIYLTYSFITFNWDYSWIIFPIAGILYAIISVIMSFIIEDK